VNAGETERVARESVEILYEAFRKRPRRGKKWGSLAWHLATGYFVDAMRVVRRRFDTIEVDRLRVKPLVKITGEFYLQTVEGEPNYNIHRWLETEGAEVYPAGITIWLDYLMRLAGQDFEDHIGIDRNARLKLAGIRTGQAALRWTHDRMRKALGGGPREMPDQYELRSLAAPYYHSRLNGGEGDMLVGKALWAYHHKKAHMTCELSPYSCMPNTMSIGAMAAVLGKYPDLLYAPLEIKGDAEVHALSRCQMILTEAKKRAQREFEGVLERTRMTPEKLAAMVPPEMRKATYVVPRSGAAAGTAANFALHLAGGAS
jgi:predicted nucleotide-binding protein (sugar kinase/HSP70/actin superfamily)